MTAIAIAALVAGSSLVVAIVMSFISIYFEEKEKDKSFSQRDEDANKHK